MAYVPIPKDLTKVKTKVTLGLTKRQLVCFGAAAVGLPFFFLLRGVMPSSTAAFIMVLIILPFFILSFTPKQQKKPLHPLNCKVLGLFHFVINM